MCNGLTCQKKIYTVIHMTNQIELFWLSETIITFEKFSFFFFVDAAAHLLLSSAFSFAFALSLCGGDFSIAQGVFLHSIDNKQKYVRVVGWQRREWCVGEWTNWRWKEPTTKTEIKFNQFAYIFEMGLLITFHHFAFGSCLSWRIFI